MFGITFIFTNLVSFTMNKAAVNNVLRCTRKNLIILTLTYQIYSPTIVPNVLNNVRETVD